MCVYFMCAAIGVIINDDDDDENKTVQLERSESDAKSLYAITSRPTEKVYC